MKKIVVFASGSGSNFQTIVDKLHQKTCEVALLVCDKAGAYCLERAEKLHIPTFVFNPKEYETKADFEKEICQRLNLIQPDLIVLAGYMRIVPPEFVSAFPQRIINIHPALLPSFPGLHGQRQALEYGVKISGCTVHYVDEGMDTGKIIAQRAVPVLEGDTEETLSARILKEEHQLYPAVVKMLAEQE